MEKTAYVLNDVDNLVSPTLVYYKDIVLANTRRIIDMAGGAQYLWPHVKSHKTAAMIQMQLELGITRFKCATVAEAEMVANAASKAAASKAAVANTAQAGGGMHIILAYPLIGPNVRRFLRLAKAFPSVVFYAIGDNFESLSELSKEAGESSFNMNVLIDVDIGMHRTGVPLEHLEALYEKCAALKNISLKGLHCYDGHRSDSDINRRKALAGESDAEVLRIQKALTSKGLDCGLLVMGGSPSFPCRTGRHEFYLSPGTIFIGDWGYYSKLPDLAFTPGAAIFCRVVSHQPNNTFTLDLGCKGIAADPAAERGIIAGLPEAKPVFQSEEHWVFSLPPEIAPPAVGSVQYVIPTHICPTSALYPELQIASGGKLVETWKVDARNRALSF
jgi:D-serine deaminase-like pyridoxal phosphate-dependent protein